MNNISLCMIAKNEAKKIGRSLEASSKLGVEIVIVDTGSSDTTKEIASKYTDKIYDFEWCNDFSAARNFSISKASNDWILILDCDDYLESFNQAKLQQIVDKSEEHFIGEIMIKNQIDDYSETFDTPTARFFNKNYCEFKYAIHEQICPIKNGKVTRGSVPITVFHDGYAGTTEEKNHKSNRNKTLLLESIKNNPNSPYLYYKLGNSYSVTGDYEQALIQYQKALEFNIDPAEDSSQLLIISYGETLLALNRYEEAMGLLGIYDEFATSADFICLVGLIYYYNNEPINALMEFGKALATEKHFRSDTNNNYPRYHIALIYEKLGKIDDAITFYKSCTNYEPAKKKLEQYTH